MSNFKAFKVTLFVCVFSQLAIHLEQPVEGLTVLIAEFCEHCKHN